MYGKFKNDFIKKAIDATSKNVVNRGQLPTTAKIRLFDEYCGTARQS
jgi:hypothetical protein